MFKHIKDNKGFSLIELMVVVAIIGILAAIAVPSFNNYRNRAKLSGAKAALSGVYTEVKVLEAEGDILSATGNVPANNSTLASSTLDFANDTIGTNKINAPNSYTAVGFHGGRANFTNAATGAGCTYTGPGGWNIGAKAVAGGESAHVDETKKFQKGSDNANACNEAAGKNVTAF